MPPVVAYQRVQYRQRHSDLPVLLLRYWVWGSGSGMWFHTQVVRGRFTGKMEHGVLVDEKTGVGSSKEEERNEKSGEIVVVID